VRLRSRTRGADALRRDFLDRNGRLDSPIHRARPAVELVATLALVIATAFLPRQAWALLAVVLALLLATAAASQIPWRFVVRRVLWLEPFVLGVALLVLLDESGRMKRARASRSFTRQRSRTWHAMATVASQLFIRSTERADRIWAAMCARGWR